MLPSDGPLPAETILSRLATRHRSETGLCRRSEGWADPPHPPSTPTVRRRTWVESFKSYLLSPSLPSSTLSLPDSRTSTSSREQGQTYTVSVQPALPDGRTNVNEHGGHDVRGLDLKNKSKTTNICVKSTCPGLGSVGGGRRRQARPSVTRRGVSPLAT